VFGISDLTGWLKLIHVVAAVGWVGGMLLMQYHGARMAKADGARRLQFAEDSQAAGTFFSVAGMLTLAAGVWLVLRVDVWEFSQTWITIGFAGVALGVVLGMGYYGPKGRQLIAQIKAGESGAAATARQIGMVSLVETVILLIVVWAMVFKPGL
jgi:uncharacterized membrane protein